MQKYFNSPVYFFSNNSKKTQLKQKIRYNHRLNIKLVEKALARGDGYLTSRVAGTSLKTLVTRIFSWLTPIDRFAFIQNFNMFASRFGMRHET